MSLTTQELGALAELRFQTRCVERGVDCFAPIIGGNKGVDFVILHDSRLVRVQVKKATVTDGNGRHAPRIKAQSKASTYAQWGDLFDFYAFVCLELNCVWLFPADEVNSDTWSCALTDRDRLNDYLF